MKSLVSYIDILGYQEFLKNNSGVDTAREVFRVILDAPRHAANFWSDEDNLEEDEEFEASWVELIENVKSLVFSDTIVVSLPCSSDGPSIQELILFSGISNYIYHHLFKYGLPSRGCLVYDSFVYEQSCIAGRAVVDAHIMSSKLEFSGFVIDPNLEDYIASNEVSLAFFDKYHPFFLCPLKDEVERKMRVSTALVRAEVNQADTLRYVQNIFWKWSKDISQKVDHKILNTVKLINFVEMHISELSEIETEQSV